MADLCTSSVSIAIDKLWDNYNISNKQDFSIIFKFGDYSIELPVKDNLTKSEFQYSVSSLVTDCLEQK